MLIFTSRRSRRPVRLGVRPNLFFLFFLIFLLKTTISLAQPGCKLKCQDSVKISMFDGCTRQVNGDFVAGQTSCIGPKKVEIFDQTGAMIGDKVFAQHVGQLLAVRVTSIYWGDVCWGSIVPTDTRPPKITAKDTAISCVLPADPQSIGFPTVWDECSAIKSLDFVDSVTTFACETKDFVGPFQPACWTFCLPTGDAAVDTMGKPHQIILQGASHSMPVSMAKYRTAMKIHAPAPGYFQFDWQLFGAGNPASLDALYFTIGDTACYKLSGVDTLSGTYTSKPLPAGAWISIEVVSNGDALFNTAKIFNFKFVTTAAATIKRCWTATDTWENSTKSCQYITLNRADVNHLVWPKNRDDVQLPSLECGTVLTDALVGMPLLDDDGNPATTNDQHPANPNSPFCTVAISKNDQIFPLCGGSYAIARTWSAIDDCNQNVATHVQFIKILDKTAPSISCQPTATAATNSTDCFANVLLAQPTATDACSPVSTTATWNFGSGFGPFSNVPTGNHTILYTATDGCGNTATCSQVLTVSDLTEPTMICAQNVVASLTQNGEATLFPSHFDNGTFDNCCLNLLEIKRLDLPNQSFSNQITFTAADVSSFPKPILLKASDCHGNSNSCQINLVVQDKLPPIFLNCPANLTIDCSQNLGDLSQFGTPTANDNSSMVNLNYTFSNNLNSCSVGQIVRSWTATDPSGNSSVCSQLIFVENQTPWNGATNITWPSDYSTATCTTASDLDPASLAQPFSQPILQNVTGCEQPATAHEDEIFQFQGGVCLKILRKWTVVDWCNYSPGGSAGIWQHVQTISVMDNQPPNFINPPADLSVGILGNSCSATVILPQISIDDCQPNAVLTASSPFGAGFGPFQNVPQGVFPIVFTASDGCGNSKTLAIQLTVRDEKPPQAVCKNGLAASLADNGAGVGELSLGAAFFNQSSSDNCTAATNLQFSFSQNAAEQTRLFHCSDLGDVPIFLYVTDATGNQSVCSTYLLLEDNNNVCGPQPPQTASISGQILTEIGQPISQAAVGCTSQAAQITGAAGAFLFQNLTVGGAFEIEPTKNINVANGVTTFDLNRIDDHINGGNPISSPYKRIAADATNDQQITQADIDAVKDVLLFNAPSFPNNTSWRFLPADFQFPDPAEPWGFPEKITILNLTASLVGQNFVGVKIGDLNNSANPQLFGNLPPTDDRSGQGDTLVFHTAEKDFFDGETFSLPVAALGLAEFESYQLTFEFDTAKLDFLGFLNSNLADFGLTRLSEGSIMHVWMQPKNVVLAADQPVFNLLFRGKTSGQMNSSVKISSKFTAAAAFKKGDLEEQMRPVRLDFDRPIDPPPPVSTTDLAGKTGLVFNGIFPNPLSTEARVEYVLPVGGMVRLRVFDEIGRLVFEKTTLGTMGKNSWPISFSDGKIAAGLLFFRLETEAGTAVGRLVKE